MVIFMPMDPHPENKTPYIVYINDIIISQGENPVEVFKEAESKIQQGGHLIVYQGALISEYSKITPVEAKILFRGLSKGAALWVIDNAYREVRKRLSDMRVMGLTESEAVVYIVKEYAKILPTDCQKCSEAILNTEFSPQYFSKTYTRAKMKLSQYTIEKE